MIHCVLWSITLMIASIVLAAKVADVKDDIPPLFRNQWKFDTLNASYVSRMYQFCHCVLKTRFSEKFLKS